MNIPPKDSHVKTEPRAMSEAEIKVDQYERSAQRKRDRLADEVKQNNPDWPPEVIASFRLSTFWGRIYSILLERYSLNTTVKPFYLWDDQDREAAQRALAGVALAAQATDLIDLIRAAHAALEPASADERVTSQNIDESARKLSQVLNLIERGSRL